MENASKALIMAGSILIALMVIAAVRFMFLKISDLEQTKIDTKAEMAMSDYLETFEQFNRDLYGSELLSLANLRDDYTRSNPEAEGYSNVTIKVTIATAIPREDSRGYYLTAGEVDITKIVDALTKQGRGASSLESDMDELANEYYRSTGKTIKYLSQINKGELAKILGVNISGQHDDYTIEADIRSSGYGDLLDKMEQYENLKRSYTQFKTTKFELLGVSYDDLGRIKRMSFREIPPV